MSNWPHAPVHRLVAKGAYIITAGTYRKIPFFNRPDRLSLVRDQLFSLAQEYDWSLQAWAFLSNHYHLVGLSPDNPESLRQLLSRLHTQTAHVLNQQDGTPGRRVWYQYWDTLITHPESYYARLHYVHQNPVHHRVVVNALFYEWCSSRWFERTANPSHRKTVYGFKTDRLNVYDEY